MGAPFSMEEVEYCFALVVRNGNGHLASVSNVSDLATSMTDDFANELVEISWIWVFSRIATTHDDVE
jgi:hypothetical protein